MKNSFNLSVSSESKFSNLSVSSESKFSNFSVSSESKFSKLSVSSESKFSSLSVSSESKFSNLSVSSESKFSNLSVSSEVVFAPTVNNFLNTPSFFLPFAHINPFTDFKIQFDTDFIFKSDKQAFYLTPRISKIITNFNEREYIGFLKIFANVIPTTYSSNTLALNVAYQNSYFSLINPSFKSLNERGPWKRFRNTFTSLSGEEMSKFDISLIAFFITESGEHLYEHDITSLGSSTFDRFSSYVKKRIKKLNQESDSQINSEIAFLFETNENTRFDFSIPKLILDFEYQKKLIKSLKENQLLLIGDIDFDSVWAKVLDEVQPSFIQSHLKPNTNLISIAENTATIIVQNEQILKDIKNSSEINVRDAFKKLFNQLFIIDFITPEHYQNLKLIKYRQWDIIKNKVLDYVESYSLKTFLKNYSKNFYISGESVIIYFAEPYFKNINNDEKDELDSIFENIFGKKFSIKFEIIYPSEQQLSLFD